MAQRNILLGLIRNIIDSLKPRKFRGEIVGKDQFGNNYYQILASVNQRKQRWFEPMKKDDFSQEIPAEWESWLRYRRELPPTEEEVLGNAAIAAQKKSNAIGKESKFKIDSVSAKDKFNTFPKYDEYEIIPGIKQETENSSSRK